MSEEQDHPNSESEPEGSTFEDQQTTAAEEQQTTAAEEQPISAAEESDTAVSQDPGIAAEELGVSAPLGSDSEPTALSEVAVEQGAQAEEIAPEVKEESRFGRFLKRALRWAVGLLFVFTLGVVAMQFVRVQPLRDEVNSLNRALIVTETTLAQAQAEVERLEGVEAQNEALSNDLLAAEAKLALLDILVDVTRAQLALAQEDPVGVAAALQGTGDRLSEIRDLMVPSALEGLQERLVLVLSEVDSDPFAAQRDLEILANTLLELEQELSGQ